MYLIRNPNRSPHRWGYLMYDTSTPQVWGERSQAEQYVAERSYLAGSEIFPIQETEYANENLSVNYWY